MPRCMLFAYHVMHNDSPSSNLGISEKKPLSADLRMKRRDGRRSDRLRWDTKKHNSFNIHNTKTPKYDPDRPIAQAPYIIRTMSTFHIYTQ